MNNKELIEEKKKQIEVLKEEIRELSEPRDIASRLRTCMSRIEIDRRTGEIIGVKKYHNAGTNWNFIKSLCIHLIREGRPLKKNERIYIKNMTKDEIKICSEMANEMVEVWNKYVRILYEVKLKEQMQTQCDIIRKEQRMSRKDGSNK